MDKVPTYSLFTAEKCLSSNLAGVPSSQIVQKLEHDLLSKYDKSVIPKTTLDKGVPVTLDLALNQIIDVVSSIHIYKTIKLTETHTEDSVSQRLRIHEKI